MPGSLEKLSVLKNEIFNKVRIYLQEQNTLELTYSSTDRLLEGMSLDIRPFMGNIIPTTILQCTLNESMLLKSLLNKDYAIEQDETITNRFRLIPLDGTPAASVDIDTRVFENYTPEVFKKLMLDIFKSNLTNKIKNTKKSTLEIVDNAKKILSNNFDSILNSLK